MGKIVFVIGADPETPEGDGQQYQYELGKLRELLGAGYVTIFLEAISRRLAPLLKCEAERIARAELWSIKKDESNPYATNIVACVIPGMTDSDLPLNIYGIGGAFEQAVILVDDSLVLKAAIMLDPERHYLAPPCRLAEFLLYLYEYLIEVLSEHLVAELGNAITVYNSEGQDDRPIQ